MFLRVPSSPGRNILSGHDRGDIISHSVPDGLIVFVLDSDPYRRSLHATIAAMRSMRSATAQLAMSSATHAECVLRALTHQMLMERACVSACIGKSRRARLSESLARR